jgi:hypothetical protein
LLAHSKACRVGSCRARCPRPTSFRPGLAPCLVPEKRAQVAFVDPDRVAHADVRQLAGLAQAIDRGDAHPQSVRNFASAEVRADHRGRARPRPLGLHHQCTKRLAIGCDFRRSAARAALANLLNLRTLAITGYALRCLFASSQAEGRGSEPRLALKIQAARSR